MTFLVIYEGLVFGVLTGPFFNDLDLQSQFETDVLFEFCLCHRWPSNAAWADR